MRTLRGALLLGSMLGCSMLGCKTSPSQEGAKTPEVPIRQDAGPVNDPLVPSTSPVSDGGAPKEIVRSNEENRALIRTVLAKISKIRGLASKKEIKGETVTRKDMLAKIRGHVAEEVPKEAINNEGLFLKLLGFAPASLDYEKEIFALLESQVAGFYDPKSETMYLANDVDASMSEPVLSHELVHALQDVHYNLKEKSKYRRGESDLSLASSSIAEGDATSSMMDYAIRNNALFDPNATATALGVSDEYLVSTLKNGGVAMSASTVPPIMMKSLVAPYAYGLRFVHSLRRKGGWKMVDDAWKAPPVTTEQILHPEKWKTHEKGLAVETPTFATLGAGWTLVESDRSGELSLLLAFEEWTGDDDLAATLASDWGGDRTGLYSKPIPGGAEIALAWKVRYDKGKKAGLTKQLQPLFDKLKEKFPPKIEKTGSFTRICFERGEVGPLTFSVGPDSLLVLAGPTESKTDALWKSSGTCANAFTWAKENAK